VPAVDPTPPLVPDPSAEDQARAFLRALSRLTPRIWVTPVIVALNLGLFVVMVASGVDLFSPGAEELVRWGATFGPLTASGQWWRLASAMFIHIGLLHVAMNMWVLWSAGPLVERLLGHTGFALTYLLSGLLGGLASLWWNPAVVSAGASGAVFGVYGALSAFLIVRRHVVPLQVLRGLRTSTLVFVAYNLVFGLMIKGIDMAAHVGGLLGGLACALPLARELTEAAWRRRWRANLVLALAGAGLLVGGAALLRNDAAALQREIDRFVAVETTNVDRYNQALGRLHRGEITDAQMARLLRTEVLPSWIAAGRRLERLRRGKLPAVYAERAKTLVRYVKLREEGWTLLARALEEQDRDKAERATRLQKEAEGLLDTVKQGRKE